LLKKYPNDANVVIKQFPLKMHKAAKIASIASLAAAKQNKCLELSQLMFKDYKKLDDALIRTFAEKAGLDMASFDKDIKDPALSKIIDDEMKQGKKVGVRGVPAIYVNGKPAKKARSLQGLSNMIDAALKASK
jgi:protein-disulfide isomerase